MINAGLLNHPPHKKQKKKKKKKKPAVISATIGQWASDETV
jgi:hypothetical protein